MKLLRVKYPEDNKGPFRSIQPGFAMAFNPRFDVPHVEPIGLAGSNGSGKSNILEFISEVFYYVDEELLAFAKGDDYEKKNFGFEIDYALRKTKDNPLIKHDMGFRSDESYYVVRVVKEPKEHAQFFITGETTYQEYYLNEKKRKEDPSIRLQKLRLNRIDSQSENIQFLLPNRVFGYTSGQNELLSNCYYKMQFHYFERYKELLAGGTSQFYFENSRLFFSDTESNAAVFVANNLLGNRKKVGEPSALDTVNDVVEVTSLHSFRITIRYTDHSQEIEREIKLNRDLERRIELLKACATTYYEKGRRTSRILTLDYLVNVETEKAFEECFGDEPFDLYKTFYELDLLNFYALPEKAVNLATNGPKWLNISDELPKPEPDKLVFRIEKVQVTKKGVNRPFYYKGLSDGEHQFLQIVGLVLMARDDSTLFLLDEPDTHFNPLWRSRLVSTINKVLKYYRDLQNDKRNEFKEVVITTHSPFVLSDLKQKNVYWFQKENNRLKFKDCHFQTFGASASIIMDELFSKEESISEMALNQLRSYREREYGSVEDIMRAAAQLNENYGDSVEKFDLFGYLQKLKDQMS